MTLTVPAGSRQGRFTIAAVPDPFDGGTRSVPAAGRSVTANVVPEPGVPGAVGPAAVGVH